MSDAVQIALIVAAGPVVLGLVTMFLADKHRREDRKERTEVKMEVKQVHTLINSRWDEMKDLIAKKSHAEGVLEEKDKAAEK